MHLLLVFLSLAVVSFGYGQSIVPDGTTVTSSALDGAGKTIVQIAPVISSGISHNKYTTFNVDPAGAELNNSTVNARTILNEVTSTNPSFIRGAITVAGAQANVILANPNGIAVNGGTFLNMGGLVLSTGAVSFQDRTIGPGLTQRNVVLDVSRGKLEVGAGGLAGAFTTLQLAAKEMVISGNVTNNRVESRSTAQLIAGSSRTEFDSSVFPDNDLLPWSVSQPVTTVQAGAVLIDVSDAATISSSRVLIAVTDQGAGVRSAGAMVASAGEFILTSSGEVRLRGARITAARDLVIRDAPAAAAPLAARFSAANDGVRKTTLSAGGAVEIISSEVRLTSVEVDSGTDGTSFGDLTLGAPSFASPSFSMTGELVIEGSVINGSYEASKLKVQRGGINLAAEGQALRIEGSLINADELLTVRASQIDLLAGSTGFNSRVEVGQVEIVTPGAMRIERSKLEAQTDLTIDALSFVQSSGTTNGEPAAETAALSGGLFIQTRGGSITNNGGILRGKKTIAGNVLSLGGVTLMTPRQFLNQTFNPNFQAVVSADGDGIHIQADTGVLNTDGRIVSAMGLRSQSSTGAFVNQRGVILAQTDIAIDAVGLRQVASAGAAGIRSEITALNGGLLVRAGSGAIENTGGILRGKTRIATEADSLGGVTLKTTGNIRNETLGLDTLAVITSDSDDIILQAGGRLDNLQGRMVAGRDLIITAPGGLRNETFVAATPAGAQITTFTTTRRGFLFFRSRRQSFSINYGNLMLPGERAFLVGRRNTTISTSDLENLTSDIVATEGDLVLNATSLRNFGSLIGQGGTGQAESSAGISGGNITAGGALTTTVTGRLNNTGGNFIAGENLTVTANEVSGDSLTLARVLDQRNGLRETFFGQTRSRLIQADVGGEFISLRKDVLFFSPNAVQLNGGDVTAAGEVVASSGILRLRTPSSTIVSGQYQIGLFSGFFR